MYVEITDECRGFLCGRIIHYDLGTGHKEIYCNKCQEKQMRRSNKISMLNKIKNYFNRRREIKHKAKEEFDRKFMKCGECEGAGKHTIWHTGKGEPWATTIRCQTCQGAKYVLRTEFKETCQNCCGKGFIEKISLR